MQEEREAMEAEGQVFDDDAFVLDQFDPDEIFAIGTGIAKRVLWRKLQMK